MIFGLANAGMINKFLRNKFIGAAIISSCFLILGCENDIREVDELTKKVTMVEEATKVESLFSQGGRLKAKLTAPVMLRYQSDSLEFPKTLHVDFYDSLAKKESELDALYGKYYETLHKVLLRDSVVVSNIKGDTLKCPELWWNQDTQKFYTDKRVRIKTVDKILYGGLGMEADQDLTNITIFKPTGVVMLKANEGF